MNSWLSALLRALGLLGALAPAGAAAAPRVAPESDTPWRVEKHAFKKKSANENVSGFACSLTKPNLCLIAVDEGREAAFMRIEIGRLSYIDKPFPLCDVDEELDAEGVAADEKYFYLVGSHAVKRENRVSDLNRRRIYRIASGDGGIPDSIDSSDGLWSVMENLLELAPHLAPQEGSDETARGGEAQAAGHMGVNIEAIAALNGRLFFGLRGPNLNGQAFVVSVDAKSLFEGGDKKPALAKIVVGEKRGFRDFAAAEGEILALVGPDDDSARVDYSIFELRGLSREETPIVRELAILNLDKTPLSEKGAPIKPEAITLLDATPSHYRLLVLSDGGENGAPLVFNVPR